MCLEKLNKFFLLQQQGVPFRLSTMAAREAGDAMATMATQAPSEPLEGATVGEVSDFEAISPRDAPQQQTINGKVFTEEEKVNRKHVFCVCFAMQLLTFLSTFEIIHICFAFHSSHINAYLAVCIQI